MQARPELDDPDVAALAQKFFASPQGALFGRRHRDLFWSLVEFGGDSGAGDPMRWNQRRAQEWLFDHLLDDYHCEYLGGREAAPLLLRAFVHFAHPGVGIRAALTDAVLAAIESWEPKFQAELHRKLDEDGEDWLPAASGDV